MTRDEHLEAARKVCQFAPVQIQVGGAARFVRILTVAQSDAIAKQIDSNPRKDETLFQRIATIAAMWCDEDGQPLFNLDKPEDVASLTAMPTWFVAEFVAAGLKANDGGK
jgi:hypothetical protein